LVKIRLKRMGTTKRPFYRLVVADSRSPRDGRFIESLGYYDPLPRPAKVSIDAERVREWLRRGARPTDSARDLLVAEGILDGDGRRRAAAAAAVPELEDGAAEVAEAAPAAGAEPSTTEPMTDAVAPPPAGEAGVAEGGSEETAEAADLAAGVAEDEP